MLRKIEWLEVKPVWVHLSPHLVGRCTLGEWALPGDAELIMRIRSPDPEVRSPDLEGQVP